MKRFSTAILTLCFLTGLSAQTPFYILFNKTCMDQLEYKYTYYGNTQQAYSIRQNAADQYVLTAANDGITSPTLPNGTVSCQDLKLTSDFVDLVNGHTRNVYMVHQRSQGDYLMIPLVAAVMISHNGAFYLIRGATYAFALDTTRLVNETNLSTASSASYVYFTGYKQRGCRTEYSFRREPAKTNLERSDFDLIPGIGITSDRSGNTASEAESNAIRLVKFDGIAIDDYLEKNCGDKRIAAPTTVSPWTPPVVYNNSSLNGPPAYREPDKEDASMQNRIKPASFSTVNPATGLVNCPDQPGSGYHIVQPGENLRAIARTYQVKEADIIAWNNIKNPNKIEICQKIWLKKPASAAKLTANTPAPAKAPGTKKVIDQSSFWNKNSMAKGNPTYPAPANYSTLSQPNPSTGQPAAPARTHKVKSGEYLYKIARMYGCAEECIRRANNMKLEGDVALWPGQILIIPECTCGGTAAAPPQPVSIQNPQNYVPPPANTFSQPAPTQPAASQPQVSGEPAKSYFTEYIVQQGETLNSIAYKFKVSAAELSQVNAVSPTEPLTAGKRLLIPHNQ